MTEVGPMFLAAVLAETFEEYSDDGLAHEAGHLLHETLTRHGYWLTLVDDERRQVEDAAWGSVYLHRKWRWLTQNMTTEERTAAADAVERDWARAEADDPNLTNGPESRAALRWWEAERHV